MTTCTTSISSVPFDSIQVLNPSTITPVGPINGTVNKLFRFKITSSYSVSFTVNLTPSLGSTVNAQLSIFSYNETTGLISSIGSVALNNLTTNFTRDFEAGSYIICIRPVTGSYTGTIIGNFTKFPGVAMMSATMYHGQTFYSNTGTIDVPQDIECNDALYFTLIDGKLPPGLQMSQLGLITGRLPNLDCIEDTAALSPSVNWYYKDFDGSVQPWGFQWRFKVRVYLSTNNAVFADEWFCIKVHNNWSIDRDNFVSQIPFERFRKIEIVEEALRLPDTVCVMPCDLADDAKVFEPSPILEAKCPSCDADQEVRVELIPLPPILKKKPATEIALWYAEYGNRIFESPEMNEFSRRLKESEAWRLYMAGIGMADRDDTTLSDLIVSVATNPDGFLQISVIDPIENENDLDVMLERLRVRENQKLPITPNAYVGETLSASLFTTNDIGKFQ